MRNEIRLHYVFLAAALLLGTLLGCKPVQVGPVKLKPGLRYDPPVIPISITLSPEGVGVSIEGRVKLPIGTFSALEEVDYPAGKRLLVVALADKTYTYELDDRTFEVALPNDLNAASTVGYRGGNIIVTIPHPVTAAAETTASAPAVEPPPSTDTAEETTTTSETAETETASNDIVYAANRVESDWFVVKLLNDTDETITYRITDGSESHLETVEPGRGWIHWFRAPTIEVRYASGCECVRYNLDGVRVSTDPSSMSDPPNHEYAFVVQDGRLTLADRSRP